jgi:hypothetical protein
VFSTTFSNNAAISLMEEATSHSKKTLSRNVVSSTPRDDLMKAPVCLNDETTM